MDFKNFKFDPKYVVIGAIAVIVLVSIFNGLSITT